MSKLSGTIKIEDLLHKKPTSLPKVIAFLDKLPPDEVVTTKNIIEALGISHSSLDRLVGIKDLQPYRTKIGVMMYWGCPAAIKTLKSL